MELCQNITPGVWPIKWLLLSVEFRKDDRLNTAAEKPTHFLSAQAFRPQGRVNQESKQFRVKSSNQTENRE